VGHVNRFVSELLTNFEHTLHTSNYKHLKVELRGDTHEQLHIEVIMEGFEGTSSGSSGDHVHHRGLHFHKVAFSEELPQEVDDFVSSLEDSADGLVDDEIEVALAIPGVLVHDEGLGFALLGFSGLGEHVHAVGKALDNGGAYRQLTSLGAADASLNTNDISSLELSRESSKVTASVELSSSKDLYLLLVTLQVDED